jgi:hypothetical protein
MPVFVRKQDPVEARQFFSPVSREMAEWCPGLVDFKANEGSKVKATICVVRVHGHSAVDYPKYYVREGDWIVHTPRGVEHFWPIPPDEFKRKFIGHPAESQP